MRLLRLFHLVMMMHYFSNVVDDYEDDSTTETAIILLLRVRFRFLAMCFSNCSSCSQPKFQRHNKLLKLLLILRFDYKVYDLFS